MPVRGGRGGDAHAGHTETSVLLHISPADVLTDRWLAGNSAPLPELLPSMRRGGVAAVSAVGVLGDPTTATAAEGERMFAEMVDGGAPDRVAGGARARRDADMTQTRLPDGFAVQVDRRVRVLGDGPRCWAVHRPGC